MSAPINLGHSVHAVVGVCFLCVFSWFFPRRKPGSGPGSAFGVAPKAIEPIGAAARGTISVPFGSIITFFCWFMPPPPPRLHRHVARVTILSTSSVICGQELICVSLGVISEFDIAIFVIRLDRSGGRASPPGYFY